MQKQGAHKLNSFWIDRGGTFTDCIQFDPRTRETRTHKRLSSDTAPLECIRELLELGPQEDIPPCNIRMGTTVATNALLERKGARFALITNEGFQDLWKIGHQARSSLFELRVSTPEVLYEEVLTISGRIDTNGVVIRQLDADDIRSQLHSLRNRGIENIAVVLIHAHVAPEHEILIGKWANEIGFRNVSLSHEVDCRVGLLDRGNTCSVDAYLTPLLNDYLEQLEHQLPGSRLALMQSSGGLCERTFFRGHNAVLSGPAGGVVGLKNLSQDKTIGSKLVGFDMGGTSTDVTRFNGEIERVYNTEMAGIRIRSPMMSIHTVAAGGGSICRYEDGRLCVGPQSAGSNPGPLCYGNQEASELTVTDINLILGRISDDRFPFPLHRKPVQEALEKLSGQLEKDLTDIANGFLQVANHHMAEAIRRITIARGHDVREFSLVVFGGAGGQHACAIADVLNVDRIVSHPLAGVFSAYGIGLADTSWHGHSPKKENFKELIEEGRAVLRAQGFIDDDISIIRRVDIRYAGTETNLCLPYKEEQQERYKIFSDEHLSLFGYSRPGHPIEEVGIRVELIGSVPQPPAQKWSKGLNAEPIRTTEIWSKGQRYTDAPVYLRESLERGQKIPGPAIILENTATFVVDKGWVLTLNEAGVIILEATHRRHAHQQLGPELDVTNLEIFNHSFMSIAEQMGVVLERTAISTNIRERLDFSCAVFDRFGQLVANAPHIPVHLGAMGESVRAVISQHSDIEPGDIFATNDPNLGGSHLPDITVVSPIHDPHGELLFFTANRGHHFDVGGTTPGSMPPFSASQGEEGVVFSGLKIVAKHELREELILNVLESGPFPARDPRTNLADLRAQIAANQTGASLLKELVSRYGYDTVAAYMQHIQDNAAQCVGDAIENLADGQHTFTDRLDDETPIQVSIDISGRQMTIDFSGSGSVNPGNLNAPRAVCIAAVIYVLRCLVGKPIPLNQGCLRNVELSIPSPSILSPLPTSAVAGGNVETSQRIVDVLLAALKISAASQGTMNNLTFGTEHTAYYETIAGGAGAGESYNGASGVQTHMTNTRITDAEILEQRYPVRLVQFTTRENSGGDGKFSGGDGLIRELEFIEKMNLSILSDRRKSGPFGLMGGDAGLVGRNLHNGQSVGAKAELVMEAGDRFLIQTPGGGGFGNADS